MNKELKIKSAKVKIKVENFLSFERTEEGLKLERGRSSADSRWQTHGVPGP